MFTSNVSDLTFTSRGEGGGGFVTGKKVGKPVTTVRDCIQTLVSITPLDIFT